MKLTIACLLALSALAFSFPSVPLKTHGIQERRPLVGIIGAQLAHIQKYPYTVSTYSDSYGLISGSGTILNHNWILTTTTQLYSQNITDVTIRGGSDDGQTGGQSSKIEKVITNFTGDWSTDIALLKTKTKLVFNKNLKSINLAKFLPKEGSMASLSGFGKNDNSSGMLNAAEFKISSYSACQDYYYSDTIICSESDLYRPVFDDLGDPLVQKKQLVGIYNGYDGVGPFTFMAMAKCRDWIIQMIKENSESDEADGIDDVDADFAARENDDEAEGNDEDDESVESDSHEDGGNDNGKNDGSDEVGSQEDDNRNSHEDADSNEISSRENSGSDEGNRLENADTEESDGHDDDGSDAIDNEEDDYSENQEDDYKSNSHEEDNSDESDSHEIYDSDEI